MNNKTLGWWDIGTLVAFMLFYSSEPNSALTNLLAIAYVVFNVWAGIRLINLKD